MSRDVVYYVSNDGYEAVYIDGELADQGHSIDWLHVINELGCNTYRQAVNETWLEEAGSFPDNSMEVVYD